MKTFTCVRRLLNHCFEMTGDLSYCLLTEVLERIWDEACCAIIPKLMLSLSFSYAFTHNLCMHTQFIKIISYFCLIVYRLVI